MSIEILSAVYGYVCFQVDSGPECVASVQDLTDAKAALAIPQFADVRVDGQPVDESDVDLLLDVATRSQAATAAADMCPQCHEDNVEPWGMCANCAGRQETA